MTALELKKYIYDNKKVEDVLEKIGCGNIKYNANKDYYSASQYNGDNEKGVIIYNNKYLNYYSFTRDVDEKADLITLVEYSLNISFIEAVKYLHRILGFEYRFIKPVKVTKKQVNPLDIFTKHRNKRRINTSEIHVLDEGILNDYVPLLYIDWVRDGVIEKTRKKFGLAYSYERKRVVIPHRYWLTGELVGTNMRTVVEDYDFFGIKKYLITPTYKKSANIYGLYENYDSIQKAGYVVVYEGERSVLKRDSLIDPTGVAISGHFLSDQQARILISLNVDIVIAMDKDVSAAEVRNMCEKFYHVRNVYYIQDSYNLLGEKDSPADANNKTFQFLLKHKIKYDTGEHNIHLKSLGKK